jgi:hypothetical protein
MSGYYESEARLARIATAIAEANRRQQAAVAQASAVAASAMMLDARMVSATATSPDARDEIARLIAEGGRIKAEAERLGADADAVVVPDRSGTTTERDVSGVATAVGVLESRGSALAAGLASIADRLERVTTSDAAALEIRRALFALGEQLAANRGVMERWRPAEYAGLTDSAQCVAAELDAALREAMTLSSSSRLSERAAEADAVRSRLAATLAVADSLEAAHQQRLYMLRGLRDVCARLDFDELEPPAFEDGPESVVILRVDTGVKGRITFRLGIDSHIETDSEMDPRYCPAEFGKLSEALEEAYGVQAQFVHVGDADRPDRKTWAAKDMPTGSRSLTAQEGL